MLRSICLLALFTIPFSTYSQDQFDPVQCLPCLIGLTESHPAVQGIIENHEMQSSENGYSNNDSLNRIFNFIKYDNGKIIEAGIELTKTREKMLGDFAISSSMVEFKEMHPEIMKKKFPKEITIDVFKDPELELTALKFDWEIFSKLCQVTILVGNYNSKKDEDKFIHAVSIAGTAQYYHIPLCKNFNKTY